MLPSQVINPGISSQREMIARKEGKFHPISTTSNSMIPYEAGQCVWIQDPASKKWNPGSIKEKATEPNRAEYQRNTNFIKPRQTQDIILTLCLEHQQKCISQPLKPVPVAQPQSKQVQWMPFPQNTQRSLPQVTGRPLPQHQRSSMMPLQEFLPGATKE